MEKFEKVIKREDGTRIKFICHLHTSEYRRPHYEYRVLVMKALPRKRSWFKASDNDYSADELMNVKLEYWQTLKP